VNIFPWQEVESDKADKRLKEQVPHLTSVEEVADEQAGYYGDDVSPLRVLRSRRQVLSKEQTDHNRHGFRDQEVDLDTTKCKVKSEPEPEPVQRKLT
jgi:hypothetical protein